MLVQFKDVTKIYQGQVPGVNKINFTLEEGEFVFLIGPSGSGKTTLIKMLIRDERPSRGTIYFDDQDITNLKRKKVYMLRRQIGVIFQDYKLIQDKTAYENVGFAMEAAGKKGKEIKDTVPYVLDIVGLSDRMDAFPKELSGGEQQRVAIARAIANNPRILIADEPTGNLDPASAWDIVQILNKINNWGTTVIMSTHGTDIVNSLNKRVIQMERGTIVRDDSRGQYEFKKQFEDNIIENIEKEEKKSTKPKTQFKVNLSEKIKNSTEENVESSKQAVEKKEGVLKRIFGKKRLDDDLIENVKEEEENEEITTKPSIDETVLEDKINELVNEETNQNNKKNKKNKKHKDVQGEEINEEIHKHVTLDLDKDEASEEAEDKTSDLKNFLKEMGNTSVKDLDIQGYVSADLINAGYKTIADIIEVGPEKLAEGLIIDPEEVLKVAKAIDKLKKDFSKK